MLNAMEIANSYMEIDSLIAEITFLYGKAKCDDDGTAEIHHEVLDLISDKLIAYKQLMEHVLKSTEI